MNIASIRVPSKKEMTHSKGEAEGSLNHGIIYESVGRAKGSSQESGKYPRAGKSGKLLSVPAEWEREGIYIGTR